MIVVRHGHAEHQNLNIVGGNREFQLTPLGTQQSIDLVGKLVGLGIKKIISSPSTRCIDTIRNFSSVVGLELTIDRRLLEINVGDLWSLPYLEFIQRPDCSNFRAGSQDSFPNGEAFSEFKQRVREAMNEYILEKDILLVTHAGVINLMMHLEKEVDLLTFPHFEIPNAHPIMLG